MIFAQLKDDFICRTITVHPLRDIAVRIILPYTELAHLFSNSKLIPNNPQMIFLLSRPLWIFLFLILTPARSAFARNDFYVAPNGNDSGPGSKTAPFATLDRARQEARLTNGVTIWIHGGVYRLTQTFRLDSLDSGIAESPVMYRSMPGEDVHIIGGRMLDPSVFKSVTDEKILRVLTPEARGHVVEAQLRSSGISDFGELKQYGHGHPVVPAPLELFFNERPMQLARYPNWGDIPMGKVIDPGSVPRVGDFSNRGGTFVYADPRHARWAGLDDVWLQGTFMWGYSDDMIRVESIDTLTQKIRLSSPHLYGLGSGEPFRQYVALNILQEIDQPGEYYLDRKSGVLYFWPPEPLKGSTIAVSELERPIIALEGASHIVLQGLTVEYARGMGIYIEGGEGNLIAGCTIRNTGTIGIMMGQGSKPPASPASVDAEIYNGVAVSEEIGDLQNHLYIDTGWDRKAGMKQGVLSCDIYNTGSGGIFLGGGNKKRLIAGGSFVENCRIHDYNRRNKFLWAGVNVDGCGNRVAHNEIYNSDSQGIYVHGNDHVFEYNVVHDVAMNSDDTSPWYLGRDPSDRGNIVRYNFFHHIGRPDRMVMGIYLDDGTCGATIFGNVLYKAATYGAVYSNAGQDNIVRNNIFIESYGPAVHMKSMWYDFAKGQIKQYFGPDGIFRRRLTKSVDIYTPPYSTRYPQLMNFLDLMADSITYIGMRPLRNIMEWNVVYNCPEVLRLTGPYAAFEARNNLVTRDDPGFVDEVRMNFELRDDAAVYKKLKGFQKIPFARIGPYSDKYRKK